MQWKSVISNFYPDLEDAVEVAEKELEEVKIEDEVTDVICEECGRNMVIKYGPTESFWRVRVFQNVAIRSRTWKRQEYPARNAVKTW